MNTYVKPCNTLPRVTLKTVIRLHVSGCADILHWLEKKTNNYVSPVIKNECLKIMCLQLHWQANSCIQKNHLHCIAASECTDSSNKEQFTLCIHRVDESLIDHEDFIGLYEIPRIDSDTLVAAIKDILLRMSLSLSDCRAQCYCTVETRREPCSTDSLLCPCP